MAEEMSVEAWALRGIRSSAERIAADLEHAAKSIRQIAESDPSQNLARPYAFMDDEIARVLRTAWGNFPSIRSDVLEAEIARQQTRREASHGQDSE